MAETLLPHDAAQLIPAMTEEEFAALKADIAAHGQRDPIVLHEGKILDGRHRYRACTELNLEAKTRPWDGVGFAVDFVRSENLHRRHLTAGQRAAIAVEAETMREAEQRGKAKQKESTVRAGKASGVARRRESNVREIVPERSDEPRPRDEVASQFNTNPRYIQDAKLLRDEAPQLLEQVKLGERTLPQAKQELRRQQKREELREKQAAAPAPASTDWIIHQDDCLSVLPTLREKFRLIFADPPYNIGIDYGLGTEADNLPAEGYVAWCEQWMEQCASLLTLDGSLWVLINDEWADHFGILLRDVGLHRRAWIKWFESFGVNCSRNFNRCSRHLFYCVRDPKKFVFHEDAVSRLSDRQAKYHDKRANPGGKLWDNVWGLDPAIPRLTGTCQERLPDFPTQLPLALLEPIVRCATDPGDLVLDPFNGSGTTGVAAVKNGRRYVGIEQSPQFAEMARARLKGVAVG